MKKLQLTRVALLLGAFAPVAMADVLMNAKVANSEIFFQFQETPHYHAFMLHSPERFVIDVDNTSLQTTLSALPLGNLPIYRIRTSVNANKTLRIVLDLKSSKTPLVKAYSVNSAQSVLQVSFSETGTVAQAPLPVKTVSNQAPKPIAKPVAVSTTPVTTSASYTPSSSTSTPMPGRAQASAALINGGPTSVLGADAMAPVAVADVLMDAKVANREILFHFQKTPHYHAFMFHSPERFVIDVDNTSLQTPTLLSALPLENLPVYRIRTSVNANKTLRIVLDLKSSKTPLVKAYSVNSAQSVLQVSFSETGTVAQAPLPVKTVSNYRSYQAPKPIARPVTVSTTSTAPVITNTSYTPPSSTSTPMPGRVQASAAVINGGPTGVFGADAMTPVYGSQREFLYADAMGDYGTDDTYLLSPGLGYRKVIHNQIIGAYFFGDYEKTSLGANFWNLSPGVEWITPQWDVHLNGYIPTSTSQQVGDPVFLNTTGDDSQISFETGTYNQYDQLVSPFAVIGNGLDTEVGYSFDINDDHLRSRAYIGGYYYQAPSNTNVDNITGVTVGFSEPLTKSTSISLFNSYDQVTNYNIGVRLSMTLGGESNIYSNNVETRLFDTVERHIGVIDTGAGNYDQQANENLGKNLEYTNVYFVSENGTGNGTYGNPMALTQSSLDLANSQNADGSRIYIQEGSTYVVDSSSATNTGSSLDDEGDLGLYVHDGQEFYGRSTDYTSAASSGSQPVIEVTDGYNGFIIQEGNNTFSDLSISSSGSTGTGVIAYNNSENGDQILNFNNLTISGFSTGLKVNDNSTGITTININNASFSDNVAEGFQATSAGMIANNNDSGELIINANNSSFNNNSADGVQSTAKGLSVNNAESGKLTVNATNSKFNGNSAQGDQSQAFGLSASNTSGGTLAVNASSDNFNDNSTSGDSGYAYGANILNSGSGNLTLTVSDSSFNGNSATATNALAEGLYLQNDQSGTLTANIERSEFNSNTSDFRAFGLLGYNFGSGTLNINAIESEFSSNAAVDGGAGLAGFNMGAGALNISTLSSQFYNNTANQAYGLYTYNATSVTSVNDSFAGNSTGDTN